jgi:hypothetical protein
MELARLRRRRYLVNGRFRVPFQGHRRRSTPTKPGDATPSWVSVFLGLTLEQERLAQQLLSRGGRRCARDCARDQPG